MNELSVFAGIAKNSTGKGMYALTLYCDGESMTLPAQVVKATGRLTNHFLLLSALDGLLDRLQECDTKGMILNYYSGDAGIKVEWDDYKWRRVPLDKSKDAVLWTKIASRLDDMGIILDVRGDDNRLIKMTYMASEKVRKELRANGDR